MADGIKGDLLSFPDLIELICTFCVLTKSEVLRFLFSCVDQKKNGLVNKDELIFFIKNMWTMGQLASLNAGFDYLDKEAKLSHGFLEISAIEETNQRYPQLFYPIFRLQSIVMAMTFGTQWFEERILAILERKKRLETGAPDLLTKVKLGATDLIQRREEEKILNDVEKWAKPAPEKESDLALLMGVLFPKKRRSKIESRKQQLLNYQKLHKLKILEDDEKS